MAWDFDKLEDYMEERGAIIGLAHWLHEQKELCLQISTLVPNTGIPKANNLPELSRFLHSLLKALEFTHSRNVINNDIDPQNVFYDQETGTT